MKKIKRVLLFLFGVSLLCFAGCKKDVDEYEVANAVSATDLCDKTEMSGLKTTVSSEEELVKVLNAAIEETDSAVEKVQKKDAANSNVKSRAVSTPNTEALTVESAVAQMTDYIGDLINQVKTTAKTLGVDLDDLEKFEDFDEADLKAELALGMFGLLDKKITFDFDKDINVGQIKASEWLDVVCDLIYQFQTNLDDFFEEIVGPTEFSFDSKDEVKKYILENITGSNGESGDEAVSKADEYLKLLDDYIVIKKFYLGTKINADLAVSDILQTNNEDSEAKSVLGADVSTEFAAALTNVNKFAAELMKLDGEDSEINLPLKGISVYGGATAVLDILNTDISNWIGALGNSQTYPTLNKADLDGTQQIAMAICTEEGEGGYITLTIKESADAGKVLDIVETMLEDSKKDNYDEILQSYIDNVFSVQVKVSNGKKNTFVQVYNYSEFKELFDKFDV